MATVGGMFLPGFLKDAYGTPLSRAEHRRLFEELDKEILLIFTDHVPGGGIEAFKQQIEEWSAAANGFGSDSDSDLPEHPEESPPGGGPSV